MRKSFLLLGFVVLIMTNLFSQSVGIGTNTPDGSAALDIKAIGKGILIPRTSTTTRLTIPVVKGLLLYDTTTNSFWFNDGVNWTETLSGNSGWGVKGNVNTNPSTNFLGTTDNQPLHFRLNNNWAGVWSRQTRNFSIGDGALQNLITGTGNIALGSGAMGGFTNSVGTVAIGDSALYNQNAGIGSSNTAVGQRALYANNSGFYNTAIGNLSMPANTTGAYNTALGASSLRSNVTGRSNIALGAFAMNNNRTGDRNIAIGRNALYSDTVGNGTIAVGASALQSLNYNAFDETYNIAIGDSAMFSNVNSCCNIAIGTKALKTVTGTSYYNTVIGNGAMQLAVSGANNTAIGESALGYLTAASQNTAVGAYASYYTSTGMGNTSLGVEALIFNISGWNNVAIGGKADVTSTALNYAVAIGAFATVNCSNCMALGGSTATARTKVGINQSTPFTDLHIVQQSDNGLDKTRGIRLQRSASPNQWRTLIDPGNNYIFEYNNGLYSYIEPVGGTFVNASDSRLKRDIESLDNVLEKVMQLQPKRYQYVLTDSAYSTKLMGFLAQDVEQLFPDFVHIGQNGYKGIAYHNFGVIAVKAIQEQQAQIEVLQKENADMKKELLLIKNKLGL